MVLQSHIVYSQQPIICKDLMCNWGVDNLKAFVTIDNGFVRFESVQTKAFKNLETWTEPNHETVRPKPFKPEHLVKI